MRQRSPVNQYRSDQPNMVTYFNGGELDETVRFVTPSNVVLDEDTVDDVAKGTEYLAQVVLNYHRMNVANVKDWLILALLNCRVHHLLVLVRVRRSTYANGALEQLDILHLLDRQLRRLGQIVLDIGVALVAPSQRVNVEINGFNDAKGRERLANVLHANVVVNAADEALAHQ